MLYLVGSPIGNLNDISLRALAVLKEVTLIAAEDTRRSSILLKRFEISKPLVSYHEHNEARRTSELIEKMRAGEKIAVITDAGMPSISDPGYRIVQACIESGIRVEVIPGPSAVLTALVGSGLPTDKFYFGGFLPVKSGQRKKELLDALARGVTSIYFESPYRIIRSLEIVAREEPTRLICVARELTKQFEDYRRGEASGILTHYAAHPPKGEITLVIAGCA
ncbi:MAG: 16S rRNA (cytidine(1402)-2'-O)-methyltransferase [Verrucomicrobia bacterium]|nr:16S rRNA (cytidine(1402)-2'-O)-methyltransferase [Verrucomicrobiota bacterium]MBV8376412.1 16S rRNA (cytidine(1402)-2'-O)-methyltransferase [Verrucomicrobiota bacterium]